MNAYDLTRQFIESVDKLQRALDNKEANKNVDRESQLEADVQNAEEEMMAIKNKLKAINL